MSPLRHAASGCRACAADAPLEQAVRRIAEYDLDRCPSCGSILVDRCPGDAELAAIYDELFARGGYEAHRREHEALLRGERRCGHYRRRLLRLVESRVEGRTMLELGGGTGAFGVEAASRGWSYVDHDIAPRAVDSVRELGLEARRVAPHVFPDVSEGSVDAVVMWEVIEHVWPIHELLVAARRALAPGGVLVVSTPNWRRPGYQRSDRWGPLSSPPVHLGFFTAESLATVLRAAGFGRVRTWTRRLYAPWPPSARALRRSVRLALGLDAGPTVYALASDRGPRS